MKPAPILLLVSFLIILLLPFKGAGQESTPPQPRGGNWMTKQFIDEEMVYPETALKNSIEGDVNLDFIVNEQGRVEQLTIRTPVDSLLEAEALRIFKFIIWQPAMFRGKAIDSRSTLEIPFSIKHYKRACRERGYQTIVPTDVPIDSSGTIYQYKYAEQAPAPVFQSKEVNLQLFLAENFSYPDEALRKNITGVVKLNFIIEPYGPISNLVVTEHLGAGCTEEAIRLIKLLQWKPGMRDGKAIRVNVTVPIKFGLSEDGNYKVSPAAGGTTFQ
jgi:TonB family protein